MDKIRNEEVAEHRDVLKGLDAQIARLTRREDDLFKKMERGQSRDEAQSIFDALTKAKEQRQRVEKEKQEEAAAFEQLLSQNQPRALQRTGSVKGNKRQKVALPPLSTDYSDIILDEDDEEPMKREASTAGARSAPGSKTAPGGRQLQRMRRKAQLPGKGRVAMPQRDSPTIYGARKYPPVAKTHPTLITNPNTDGAVELRCPYCDTNMNKSGRDFLDGINGFCLHLNDRHKALLAPGERFSHNRTFELCNYRAVSQDVVDAIQSGNLRAYVVEEVYQELGS
ncbi:hypothetical protein KC367_g2015 [Hortaea werneckii]|nr:hypothetical protein KC367_g2015 [Hortaea werneckii]